MSSKHNKRQLTAAGNMQLKTKSVQKEGRGGEETNERKIASFTFVVVAVVFMIIVVVVIVFDEH